MPRPKGQHTPATFHKTSLTRADRKAIKQITERLVKEALALLKGPPGDNLVPASGKIGPLTSRYLYVVTYKSTWVDDQSRLTLTAEKTSTFPNTPRGKRAAKTYAKQHPGATIRKPRRDARPNRVRVRVDKRNKINGAAIGRRQLAKQK